MTCDNIFQALQLRNKITILFEFFCLRSHIHRRSNGNLFRTLHYVYSLHNCYHKVYTLEIVIVAKPYKVVSFGYEIFVGKRVQFVSYNSNFLHKKSRGTNPHAHIFFSCILHSALFHSFSLIIETITT